MIELPMPTTAIVLKKFECSSLSKFMGNYDYYMVIIHNSMITIRPTSSPFKLWHDYLGNINITYDMEFIISKIVNIIYKAFWNN